MLQTETKTGKLFWGRFYYSTLVLVLSINISIGQLVVENNPTLDQITDEIVGQGFYIQSSTLNCPNGAFGLFDGLNTNIGIDQGVLLTTGSANAAIGPNNSISTGINNGAPGDNQLDVLSAATTFDGCVLEMDLIPSCDTLRINYVFGSEEYPEFVGQEFNDVFAFFVSGPGIVGSENVALIPNTTTAVAVNSVNPGANSNYYVDNTNGNSIQYDGFTTVLEGKIGVQLCETYHLKIAVADVVDGIYESGVFIQGNSVKCNDIVYTDEVRNISGTEGCSNGSFTFCREGDMTVPYVINLNIGGTAINGVDYQTISNQITIPPGDTCVTVDIIPINDNLPELDETIEIVYQPGPCPIGDTIVLVLKDPSLLNAGPDVNLCSGETRKIGKDSIAGSTYSWLPVDGLSDPTLLQPNLTLENNTIAPITHQYIQAANNGICEIYDTIEVTVYPLPNPVIGANNTCLNQHVEFDDLTNEGKEVAWEWDFGDNFLAVAQNTSHKYSSSGNFTVKFSVTDSAGCIGDISKAVTIWALPVPDFTVVEGCQGDSISFTGNSSTVGNSGGGISSCTWDFGDFTNQSSAMNPKHLYALAAIYNVKLTAVSDSGCIDSVTNPLNIRAKPQADFFSDTVCLNNEMEFEDNSTISNGIISDYSWNFNDGSPVILGEEDPSHIYTVDQKYTVQLIVSSGYGCRDTVNKEVVINALPSAGFYGEDVCLGNSTQFTDTSNGNGSAINNWKWNFDNSFISQDKNANVNLVDTGIHYITLIVTTIDGCVDTITGENRVLPNPVVDFGPSDVCELAVNQFENLTGTAYQLDTVASYSWDFGDGLGNSIVKNPTYTFNALGEYEVTLTAVSDSGCVSSNSKTVYVHGKPEVSFERPDVCIYEETKFANTSSVGDGYIKKLYWDFAGLEEDSMIHYPAFYFDTIGVYPVRLIAISNYGCVDSITQNATVNSKPTAIASLVGDHCLGKEVALDGAASTSANGNVVDYLWNYGDGFFSEGIKSAYTYPIEGTYELSLKIKDDKGCRDTVVETVTVLGLPDLKVLKDNLCVNNLASFGFQFEGINDFEIEEIEWDFGGVKVLNDSAPEYLYTSVGEFPFSLKLTSDSGCVINKNEVVKVFDTPFGGFVVDTVCFKEPSKIISQALPPQGSFINKWTYFLPDGTEGLTSNYNHVFDSAGVFDITQVVETNNGCRDTVVQIAKVYQIPVLEFSVENVEGCAPYCATFESDIKVENAEITFTEWDFGDGNLSTDSNPTFCFDEEGDFSMSLTVENSFGCSVTKSKESFITVSPSPVANFMVDWNNLTENLPTVQIVDNSYDVDRVEWIFGDGTSTLHMGDLSHTFENTGKYQVQQVVTNSFGCTDTASTTISVRPVTNVFIPNAITPGVTQGLNDVFYPVVYGTLRNADYNLYVYNRWGVLVFKSNDINVGWDGTYAGEIVQEDVYVYKITFLPEGSDEDDDYIMYKGHINVIR